MELKDYNQQQLSLNPGSMMILNNPLESKQISTPSSSNQTQTQSFQKHFMNNPLSSNYSRTNTYHPQSNFLLNNPLMNKDPLQYTNYTNKNTNMQTSNMSMINNNMNLFNQNQNNNLKQKPNMRNYTVKVNGEKYNLSLECNNINFCFKLEPTNNIILFYYKGEFNLSTIINKMNIVINNNNAFEQLNKVVEKSINEDNIKIIHDKLKKKMIIRFNKNISDYSSDLELEEFSNNKKLFHNIFEELNLLKFQQVQYMTLFKNNNFISHKDAINLINDNNTKNDFDNKIKNIDSKFTSQKNELINLKNELNITKSDIDNKIKNIDLNSLKTEENNDKTNPENDIKTDNLDELKNEISNIKNDFYDKINNINLNELKNEISQVKIELEDKIKNINTISEQNKNIEAENVEFNELKKEINNIKGNLEDKFKEINLDELKIQINNVKEEFDNKLKNINLDEIKNEINNTKNDFDNKIQNINLDEIKQELNNMKSEFDNKIQNINLDEIKQELNNIKNDFSDKFKNLNLEDIKNEININKNDLEEKIKNINIDEIKDEISKNKSELESNIKNINLEEIKVEISNFKNDYENRMKSIDLTENGNKTELNNLKTELDDIKNNLENQIKIIYSSNTTNNNELDNLKNELSNIKNEYSELKEKQISTSNENNELKQEILKIKEDQITKEKELKAEIKELKEENEKLKSENKKIKEETVIHKENEQNNQIKENEEELEKELLQLKSKLSEIIEKENKKEEKRKIKKERKEKIFQEEISHKFTENPDKLQYRFDILTTNNIFFKDEFAIYNSITDKKEYLASGNKKSYNIDIYDIKSNIFYTSLKAHKNGTPTVRYFLDEKKNKEYLISADFLKTIIVWDINNDYNILFTINIKDYKGSILSTILLFNVKVKQNEFNDYVISSSDDENDDFSKVYSFKDGSFIKDIPTTNKNITNYLLPWEYKDNYYIIELCLNKISINNLLTDENYAELNASPESSHFGGFVYDEKFLCCSCENGQIRIWNLDKKLLVKKIEKFGSFYFEIIPWNEKFVIAANYKNNSIDIFDIQKGELHKQINTPHTAGVRALNKIYLHKYGECLITSGHDSVIKMWSI